MGVFHSLEPFLPTFCLFFHWGWFTCSLSLSILATAHCKCIVLPPFCYQSNLKRFVVVVVSDTVVLRKSIQIIVNQTGNKYFSSSLPFPCHCIPHCCFTYSVNKECCQTLRLKKGNIIAVSSWSIQSRGEPCTESESQWKCIGVTLLSIFQVHQKS